MGRKSQEQLDREAAEQTAAMTDSPQFKDAVASAVAAAVGPLMEKLSSARDRAGTTGESTGDRTFAEELAMAISQLTDQGTGRSRVAPEIISQRTKAREEMFNLIIAARAENKVATYRLKNKVAINERLIEPVWVDAMHRAQATEIDYLGAPNEAMEPVNETAREIFTAFKLSIGSVVAGKGRDGHALPVMERLGVTHNGLVVRNSAVTHAAQRATPAGMGEVKLDGPMPAYEEAPQVNGDPRYEPLRVNHENQQGRYKDVNILGTVAQPARQTA